MMDLTKLTSAPWIWSQNDPGWGSLARMMLKGPDGAFVLMGAGVRTDGVILIEREGDAAFIVLARKAFDVLMRRGWVVSPCDGKWDVLMKFNARGKGVNSGKGWACGSVMSVIAGEVTRLYDDPFTALVEVDRWLKERETNDRR